jgi:hypothetical protein
MKVQIMDKLDFKKVVLITLILSVSITVYGQLGNRISGQVLGHDGQPLGDVNVELMDEYSRTLARARTNSSGNYIFSGLPAGRFRIRVIPYATDYEEQEQEVEIVNFVGRNSSGQTRMSGMSSETRDFQLRLRRGVLSGTTGALFVQEVPTEARKHYEKGIADLENKKEKEGFE